MYAADTSEEGKDLQITTLPEIKYAKTLSRIIISELPQHCNSIN